MFKSCSKSIVASALLFAASLSAQAQCRVASPADTAPLAASPAALQVLTPTLHLQFRASRRLTLGMQIEPEMLPDADSDEPVADPALVGLNLSF